MLRRLEKRLITLLMRLIKIRNCLKSSRIKNKLRSMRRKQLILWRCLIWNQIKLGGWMKFHKRRCKDWIMILLRIRFMKETQRGAQAKVDFYQWSTPIATSPPSKTSRKTTDLSISLKKTSLTPAPSTWLRKQSTQILPKQQVITNHGIAWTKQLCNSLRVTNTNRLCS